MLLKTIPLILRWVKYQETVEEAGNRWVVFIIVLNIFIASFLSLFWIFIASCLSLFRTVNYWLHQYFEHRDPYCHPVDKGERSLKCWHCWLWLHFFIFDSICFLFIFFIVEYYWFPTGKKRSESLHFALHFEVLRF